MEFITVEQFREQPKEVQRVFLDWWQPSVGDIYCNLYSPQPNNLLFITKGQLEIFKIFKDDIKLYRIPLFTEGQLRKFIEDKTGCKTDMVFYMYDGYDIEISKPHYIDGYCLSQKTFEYLGEDLLQAYWKVACKIAKEEVDG